MWRSSFLVIDFFTLLRTHVWTTYCIQFQNLLLDNSSLWSYSLFATSFLLLLFLCCFIYLWRVHLVFWDCLVGMEPFTFLIIEYLVLYFFVFKKRSSCIDSVWTELTLLHHVEWIGFTVSIDSFSIFLGMFLKSLILLNYRWWKKPW